MYKTPSQTSGKPTGSREGEALGVKWAGEEQEMKALVQSSQLSYKEEAFHLQPGQSPHFNRVGGAGTNLIQGS